MAAALPVVEQHRVPLAEGRLIRRRRSTATSKAAPLDAGDELGLAGRHLGEVDAAQRAGARDRAVRLGDVERVAGHLGEGVLAEPLEEHAAVVGVLDRGHLESARH